MKTEKIRKAIVRRKYHVRKKIFGTSGVPRLSIFRSNKNMYAQIIDDTVGVTLVSACTRSGSLRDKLKNGGDIKAAIAVGELIAKEAVGVGIKCVCFDRRGYKFHGRCKALADSARKAGLVF